MCSAVINQTACLSSATWQLTCIHDGNSTVLIKKAWLILIYVMPLLCASQCCVTVNPASCVSRDLHKGEIGFLFAEMTSRTPEGGARARPARGGGGGRPGGG
jgi:hypothetical protein